MLVALVVALLVFGSSAVGLVSGGLPVGATLGGFTLAFLIPLFLLAYGRKSPWGRRHRKKRELVYELFLRADDLPAEWQRLSPKKLGKNVILPLLRTAGVAADQLAMIKFKLHFWRLSLANTAHHIHQAVHAMLGHVQDLRKAPEEQERLKSLDALLVLLQHEDATQQQIQTLVDLMEREETQLAPVSSLLKVYGYDLDHPSAENRHRFREAVDPLLKTRSEKEILVNLLKGEKR